MQRIAYLILSLILIGLPVNTTFAAESATVDVAELKRPADAQLSASERREETSLRASIKKAQKLIREGTAQAFTPDGFSKLSQKKVDNTSLREAGEKKIEEGERMIERAAASLTALYARSSERNASLNSARDNGRMRVWTNKEGRSVEAAFMGLDGDKLLIQTAAGHDFAVPLDQLTDEDQDMAQFFEDGLTLSDDNFLATVESGQASKVTQYIDVGYEPSAVIYADALTICAKQDASGQTLKKLLGLGLDFDAYNSDGQTALSVAAQEDSLLAAESLTMSGASPMIADDASDGLSALMWALHLGNSEMVVLLEKGCEDLSDNLQTLVNLAKQEELPTLEREVLVELREIEASEDASVEELAAFKLNLFGLEPTITDLEKVMTSLDYRPLVTTYHRLDFYAHTIERNTEYINEIVSIWEEQHSDGDLGATYSLALNKLHGWSTDSDPVAAKLYLQEAAVKEHSPSMVLLGEFFEEGKYVANDPYQAFAFYKGAAEVGDPLGMVKLGHCYEVGIHVEKDLRKAFTWYKRATEAGSTEGMAQMGRCYMNGIGISEDTKVGLEWYTKSANANNLSAMYYLGDYLIAGDGSRSRNAKIGVEWLKKAADFGARSALNSLGEVYSNGTVKVDEPRASKYFLEAAERGEVASMYAIAGRLAVGNGIDKDEVAAFKWYESAAESGHVKATIRLAICYSSGKGVARDAAKAFKLFKQAAVDDDMEAIANLAVCYARGLGTPVNEEESARLYLEVLNSGNQTAIAIVDVLGKEE